MISRLIIIQLHPLKYAPFSPNTKIFPNYCPLSTNLVVQNGKRPFKTRCKSHHEILIDGIDLANLMGTLWLYESSRKPSRPPYEETVDLL